MTYTPAQIRQFTKAAIRADARARRDRLFDARIAAQSVIDEKSAKQFDTIVKQLDAFEKE